MLSLVWIGVKIGELKSFISGEYGIRTTHRGGMGNMMFFNEPNPGMMNYWLSNPAGSVKTTTPTTPDTSKSTTKK